MSAKIATIPDADARAQRRAINAMQPQLIAAYHLAKGLCELLNALHAGRAAFPVEEQANIRAAAASAVSTFSWLNSIVCDQGNDAGLCETRRAMADDLQASLRARLNRPSRHCEA